MRNSMIFTILLILLAFQLSALDRQEIIEAADSFAVLEWECIDKNSTDWQFYYAHYGYDSSGEECHPYCDWPEGTINIGMAYAFGGNDAVSDFTLKLSDGLMLQGWNPVNSGGLGAGCHACHYFRYGEEAGIYPVDWVTGIDCSAYVCKVWQVPRVSTSMMADMFYNIEKENAEMGDILLWPGHHVVLIADPGQYPGNLNDSLVIYEATGNDIHKVRKVTKLWAEYEQYTAKSIFPGESINNLNTLSENKEPILSNSPNPFNIRTVINYTPQYSGNIILEIFNVRGQRVYSREIHDASAWQPIDIVWDGKSLRGDDLSSGIYFCSVKENGLTSTLIKILLMK